MRRVLLCGTAVGAFVAPLAAPLAAQESTARITAPFSVVEAGVPELRAALESKRVTSRQLVEQYLARIAMYDHRLKSVITVNPHALEEADRLDRERAQGTVRGPLHGIPVALKDNIHTVDVRTTGGALAFADLVPPYDATVTTNLRAAGAIIIAKTQLSELANWVSSTMPGNYTAVGGQGLNGYDPRPDPRPGLDDGRPVLSTGGSSSGVGTSLSFWLGNGGTDTGGSILNPAVFTGLVGIRPTVGRLSRWGVIPITADQDTPGPMARTVTDVAYLMGAMESASPDPHDSATTICTPPPGRDYTKFLDANALKGARIGIPRAYYYEPVVSGASRTPRGGIGAAQQAVMNELIAVLKTAGATVVDPANIPSIVATKREDNLLDFPYCQTGDQGRGRDDDCSTVFKYGMKRDFDVWLASLGDRAPVKSLSALREWNIAHQRAGAIKYGQSRLDISDEMDLRLDRDRYLADRRRDLRLSRAQGFDAVLDGQKLDAVLFPGNSGSDMAARSGYPSITVPMGTVPANVNAANPYPAGFTPKPSPFGVMLTGKACSEPRLIALGYALEQLTKRRVPPAGYP